jgi:4-hydroxy-tetrahydrodipicolinate reductase
MGKLLEAKALERGHKIAVVVEPFAPDGSNTAGTSSAASGAPLYKTIAEAEELRNADLAIEFTRPDTAVGNILALAEKKLPVVVGTTGWLAHLDEVTVAVKNAGSALLWASNFSLGVNLFYRIAAYAAKIADPFAEYDVGGLEVHHNKKADSPSGTAKTLAERVLAQMTRKKQVVWDTLDGPPPADAIHFSSLRVGAVPGVHSLFLDSAADTIEITHTARSREGFALGALRAAEWLANCDESGQPAGKARTGVYTIDDVMAELLG